MELAPRTVWVAHEERNTLNLPAQIRKRLCARADKSGAQQQVFRGVSAQRELGRDHKARSLLLGAVAVIEDLSDVGAKVADDAINLCNRDFHGRTRKSMSSAGSASITKGTFCRGPTYCGIKIVSKQICAIILASVRFPLKI
jgi:hypothetical protein